MHLFIDGFCSWEHHKSSSSPAGPPCFWNVCCVVNINPLSKETLNAPDGPELLSLWSHKLFWSCWVQFLQLFLQRRVWQMVPKRWCQSSVRVSRTSWRVAHSQQTHSNVCFHLNEIYNDMQSVRRSSMMSWSVTKWKTIVDSAAADRSNTMTRVHYDTGSGRLSVLPLNSSPPSISCPQWELMWLQHSALAHGLLISQYLLPAAVPLISGAGNEQIALRPLTAG